MERAAYKKSRLKVADAGPSPGAIWQPGPRPLTDARTLPQQIADRVGFAIVSGAYEPGEHIPEQKLAAMFGVSHGPVREALRILGQRGLVEHVPRRGAFAIAVTIDTVADIFNIRGVLFGLAAHSLALGPDAEAVGAVLLQNSQELQRLAADKTTDPLTFSRTAGRGGTLLLENCGNPYLVKTLRDQGRGSLWGLLWREQLLDFSTMERRHTVADQWVGAARAISERRGPDAEKSIRKAFFGMRDNAIATLKKNRKQKVAPSKFIPG